MPRRRVVPALGVALTIMTGAAIATWPSMSDAPAHGRGGRPAGAATLPPHADPRAPAAIVTPDDDVPNPFVLVDDGTYYMYSSETSSTSPQIALRTSTDREHWSPITDALPVLPPWAAPGFTWAPDVRKVGDVYVMYFTAMVRDRPTQTECIGTATSKSPAEPFTPNADQLVCQLDHLGSIDPRTFVDVDGTLWLHWKSDENADTRGTSHTWIYAQRLRDDGLHLGGPRSTILTADQPWEGRIVEAPQMVLAGDHYWLFYSGNWFNQPLYAIGAAACSGPAGPCIKPFPAPLLWWNGQGAGPGEASLFEDGDGWWMVYAPWAQDFALTTPRPAALARVAFGHHGPYLAAF